MKKDIRIYDFEFNLVYIISDWISLNWELHYNKVGTFEVHVPFYRGLEEVLRDNPYLVAVQGDRQAIITGRMLTEEIAIYGRTVNWILSKRIILPFEITSATNHKRIIESKLGEIFDQDDNLYIIPNTDDFEPIQEYKLTRPKDGQTFVSTLLENEGVGHRVTFLPLKHRWEFEIYRGEERDILLSPENKNAHSPQYTHDILDKWGGAYYKDKSTDSYLLVPDDKQGIYRWYGISSAEDKETATQELMDKKENACLTLSTNDIICGRDYNIGDTICVETNFGGEKIRYRKIITGVRIWDEQLHHGEKPIFEDKGE